LPLDPIFKQWWIVANFFFPFQIVANNGRLYLKIIPIFSNNAFAWSYFCSFFYRWEKYLKNKMGWSLMWLCSIMNSHGSITKDYYFFLFFSSSCFSLVRISHPTHKKMFIWPPIIIHVNYLFFTIWHMLAQLYTHYSWGHLV
jgi:hypothetical protein